MRTLMAAILFLAGCATSGPVSAPNFSALVAQAVPAESGQVLLASAGTWQPNSRGFNFNSLGQLAPEILTGVVVITERAILFAEWDTNTRSYVVMKQTLVSEIREVTVARLGLSRELIVQRNDLAFDAYEFTRAGGNLVDSERADEAAALLRTRLEAQQASPQ